MLYTDKSQQHLDMLNDFVLLVERLGVIMKLKAQYIERTVKFNEQAIQDGLFGADGVIPLISEKILQTKQCEEFAANGLTGQVAEDEIFQRMHPTHNVDLVIRTRFLHRVRDRIHDKVCEYLHQSTQLLISDHRKDFMKADLSAQGAGS
jgi:hypothetical protein